MINCTVDINMFAVPKDCFVAADENKRIIMAKNFLQAIYLYMKLKKSYNLSFYFSYFYSKEFSDKILVANNAVYQCDDFESYLRKCDPDDKISISELKEQLKDIIRLTDDSKNKDFAKHCFFIHFLFNSIKLKEMVDLTGTVTFFNQNKDIINGLAALAFLNEAIYKSTERHFFMTSMFECLEVFKLDVNFCHLDWATEPKYLNVINTLGIKPGVSLKNGIVCRKSPKDIKFYLIKYDTLRTAVDQAKEDFKINLHFEPSFDKNFSKINKTEGIPDRVYHYLKTLNECTEYFKNIVPDETLIKSDEADKILLFLGKMYGLDCSNESTGTKNCPVAIEERLFGDLREPFFAHLKPYLPGPDIFLRIHFKRDTQCKITRIGYIGNHLFTKEKGSSRPYCYNECTVNGCDKRSERTIKLCPPSKTIKFL